MKLYIVYDGRAAGGDTDDASVLLATSNKHEALQHAKDYDGCVYSYDEAQPWKGKGTMQLVNEQRVLDEGGEV